MQRQTRFCGVDSETLVPEATHQNVAIVSSDYKAVCVDLNALVNQVSDLPLIYSRVIGCDQQKKRQQQVNTYEETNEKLLFKTKNMLHE